MNEWTEEANARVGNDRAMEFYLCEWSDRRCTQPISLSRSEYEAIRGVPGPIRDRPEPREPEIDRVLFENERFATVEKFYGVGANIARATDPRR
jgi:hypothetical protein